MVERYGGNGFTGYLLWLWDPPGTLCSMILYKLKVLRPLEWQKKMGFSSYGLGIHCVQENEAYHILEPQSVTSLSL